MIKLRFGKDGPAEPLPSGRLVTSFEGPRQPTQVPEVPQVLQVPLVQDAHDAAPAEPAAPAAPAQPDGLDALAGLVIQRLSQSPLPDSLARIVTEVSERLVREEIARIREKAKTPPPAGSGQAT